MMMIAIPSRFCRSSSSARIWAWTVTSSAVVGSSAIRSLGSLTSAIAIIARWRMPPENSCGYWSQRRQRILEDHCDVVAADLTHLIVLERDQVTPLEHHPPLDPGALLPGQPQRGERRDALARSRLPHDPQRLAGLDRVRDAIDGVDDAVVGVKRDAQILHAQQRLAHEYCTLGSR